MRPAADAGGAATRAAAAADATPPAHTCRNCGAHAPSHYCPNCGQETRVALPSFAAFMREAAGRYVALDGRLWRTLFALVARPGFLTLEYFHGRRRRYIRPARLFLVLYLVLFAVIGVLQSPADLSDEVVFVDSDTPAAAGRRAAGPAKEASPGAGADAPAGAARGRKAAAAGEDGSTLIGLDEDLNVVLRLAGADLPVPAQVRKRYDQFRKLSREEKAERLYAGMLRYGPYAAAALLPAFALLLKIAYAGRANRYPGRPRRYAEHLVYSAHLHAFMAVAILALLLVPVPPLRALLALWIVWYVIRARQRVYQGRWWGGLVRAFFVAIVYLTLMGLAVAGLVAMTVMLR